LSWEIFHLSRSPHAVVVYTRKHRVHHPGRLYCHSLWRYNYTCTFVTINRHTWSRYLCLHNHQGNPTRKVGFFSWKLHRFSVIYVYVMVSFSALISRATTYMSWICIHPFT
jgi:hypothetical protein